VPSESHDRSSFPYNPALDGLRAIAVIGVFVFHTVAWLLPGGFVGVDVFFVLSGYLITSIIVHDLRNGTFSLREFYARRIQRLMPNAVLVVAFTLTLSSLLLMPSIAWKTARHAIYTLLALSNVYVWRAAGGYWGDEAAVYPLLHTWSLAAEEQFYLLFPGVLLVLARLGGRRFLLTVVIAVALLSLGMVVAATPGHPSATFYLLPTRMWQLLLGTTLALLRVSFDWSERSRHFLPTRTRESLGWLGLGLVLLSFILMDDQTGFRGLIALLPTVGALLMLASVTDGDTMLARFLSTRPLVAAGKASYSLYLWHWPLIVIGSIYAELYGLPVLGGALVGAALSVVASVAAYRWVETPLRCRGPGRRRRLVAIAVGFSACAVFAILLVSGGRPVADPKDLFDEVVLKVDVYDSRQGSDQTTLASTAYGQNTSGSAGPISLAWMTVVKRLLPANLASPYSDVIRPPAEARVPDSWKTGGIIHRWGGETPQVVLIGSSHANMYGGIVDEVAEEMGVSVAFLTADGTPVMPMEGTRIAEHIDPTFFDTREQWIRTWRPGSVIVVDRWDWSTSDPGELRLRLEDLLARIEPYTRQVVLVSQVPVLRIGETLNLREYVTWYAGRAKSLPRILPNDDDDRRSANNRILESIAHDHPKVKLLRPDRLFLNQDGSVRYSSGRTFYYADDDHLAESGAALLRTPLTNALNEAFGT